MSTILVKFDHFDLPVYTLEIYRESFSGLRCINAIIDVIQNAIIDVIQRI